MNIHFLHDWQSVLTGVKPTYFSQHGQTAINTMLPDGDISEAFSNAQSELVKTLPERCFE